MKCFTYLVSLILFLSLLSCSSDNTPTVITPSKGSIKGYVYNSVDNKAIPFVHLTTDPPTESILTDSLGAFTLQNLTPGEITINADKNLYHNTSVKISVKAGSTSQCVIIMNPDSSSTGTTDPLDPALKSYIVAAYHFNGNVDDSSGRGNDGTPYNVTYVNDRKNKTTSAIYFDGSGSSYVEIPKSPDFKLSTFTIAIWVKVDNYIGIDVGNWVDVVGQWGSSDNSSYCLAINNSSRCPIAATWDGVHRSVLEGSNSLTPNIWHHLAYVRAGTTIYLYCDGTLNSSLANSYDPQLSNYPLRIGMRADDNTSLQGTVDDLYIFNRALSANEIKSLAK